MPRKKSGPKKERHQRLTDKQLKFFHAFRQTHNATISAALAGYSMKDADSSGHQALQQISKKLRGTDIMDDCGLTLRALIEKNLAPLLVAQTAKFAIDGGKFKDFILLEDNTTRLNALDMALRIHGAYAPQEQITKEATSVRVIIVDGPRPKPKVIDVPKSQGNGSKPNGGGGKDD